LIYAWRIVMPIKKFRFKNLGATAHYNTSQFGKFNKPSDAYKPRYAPDSFNPAVIVVHKYDGRVVEHSLDEKCHICEARTSEPRTQSRS
jgi:hypothetical protein